MPTTRQEPARRTIHAHPTAAEHEAEARRLGRETHVHRQREGRPEPDAGAVDRGDHRLQAAKEPQRDQAAAVARDVAGAQLLGAAHLRASHHIEPGARIRQIGAGAERAAAAGDHHGPHRVVGVDEIPHPQQLAFHRRIERVELLGTIERDRRDRVGDLVGDRRERATPGRR
jgi:hypothetical protein